MEPRAFKVEYKYKNSLELLDTVIYLFSKTVLSTELTAREISILREYLCSGYNKPTKKALELNLGINDKALNVSNCNLQKKGFLSPHPTNFRSKIINKDLLALKDCFINEGNKNLFMVHFIKTKDNV